MATPKLSLNIFRCSTMVIIKELANSAQSPSGFSIFSRFLNWVFDFTLVRNFNFLFLKFGLSLRPQSLSHNCSLDDNGMGFEYLRMVMDGLDVVCGDEESEVNIEESNSWMGELRMEEVKQAFDVYDAKRDGFIDAEELQRVLCGLGLEEGSEIGGCKEMIKVADENGDGVIDFNEFVNFLGRKICKS